MPARLFSDAEIQEVVGHLLPEDARMLRRLDRENFIQAGEDLTDDEKRILQKLTALLLAEATVEGRDQQWIPSGNAKKALMKWESIGKPDGDAPPDDSGKWNPT